MARVAAEGYGKKAVEFAQEALRQNPKYVEAHEFLAFLALEDSNSAMATDEAQKALALSPEALDGMAVLASMDWLKAEGENPWIAKILAVNPNYGQAYATGAHFLSSTGGTKKEYNSTAKRSNSTRICGPRALNWAST